jgi:hypothetical protein
LTAADCVTGNFCDLGSQIIGTATGACCPNYPNNTIQVDNEKGSDGECCGEGTGAQACATIGRAMGIIRQTQLYGATIAAAAKRTTNPNTGGCTFWGDLDAGSIAVENYPLQLGYGVTLSAAGVCFSPYDTNGRFSNSGSCAGPFGAFIISPFPEEDGGIPGDGGPGPFPATVALRGGTYSALSVVAQPAVPGISVGPVYDVNVRYSPFNMLVACAGIVANLDVTVLQPAAAILDTVTVTTGQGSIGKSEPSAGPAVFVGAGSSLTLGPGPVQINLTYDVVPATGGSESLDGIDCIGIPGSWATLQDDPTATSPVLSISPTNQPLSNNVVGSNAVGTELSLTHCNANLSAGPSLGSSSCAFDSYGIGIGFNGGEPDINFFSSYSVAEGEDGAQLVFGSQALPGLIHCMAHDGIIVPAQYDSNYDLLTGGPLVTIPGASIRYNDGAGIHIQAGTLKTSGSNTQIVTNDVGVQIDGQQDSTLYNNFSANGNITAGDQKVTLGSGTVVACNGSLKIVPPGNLNVYPSVMYSYTAPGNKVPFNAGADIWNQNAGGSAVDARGLAWTEYDGGTTARATCDPSCFQPIFPPNTALSGGQSCAAGCTCAGPGCPSASFTNPIPDGLDVVMVTGASVLVSGGSALSSTYCADLAQGPL